MSLRRAVEWVWYADGALPAVLRAALAPLSMVFGYVVSSRNSRLDRELATAALPAMSIGNLTVGGTGKTPVSSWFAARMLARGAKPAIVLRGYGDDEWRVHQLLTPAVGVTVNPDRRAAMERAKAQGADCAVLDDAFQHRRARRVSDIVLVSVDRFQSPLRLLPAGPYREGWPALRRATAVVLTVKAAGDTDVERVARVVREVAPSIPLAVVRLVPDRVCRVQPVAFAVDVAEQPSTAVFSSCAVTENGNESHEVGWLRDRSVLLTSAIADGDALERQVVSLGARLVRHLRFPDHYDFSADDVTRVVRAAEGAEGVLCTLKDAVKLAPLWPRAAAPLWYLSQTLVVERGAEVLERECDRVLAARDATVPTVG
ncbi:tetraacyldisaccharide 4'-kinase [Gemmatimonas sp.]